jgi:acyl-CoA synthetase (NDP forming)
MEGDVAIATILSARSIAVVGASSNPEKWGFKTLESIVNGGYDGKIYPINPKGGQILGLPVYASITEVPGDLDLVTVIVSVEAVPDTLRQSAAKGVKTVVITTAGYREGGHAEREAALKQLAGELGLRVLGPNLQGFIYTPNQLSAMFWPTVRMIGPLGLISHSGSVSAALAEWAVDDGLGISGLVNMGNQMDLCDADVLRFFCNDEHTRAVAMYVEGVRNGRAFIHAAAEAARRKPVVVLKGGHSAAGQRSVASHTGSLAGSHQVFSAACRQYGVLMADDLESLFNTGKALSVMRRPRGRRVMVVTSSGGGATLAVDEAEGQGLEIPGLPDELVQELRMLDLHFNVTLANPLDLAGVTAEHFEQTILKADQFDVADTYLIVFADPVIDSTETVKRLWASTNRNLVVAYFGGGATEKTSRLEMQRMGIPVFRSSERAMQGIAAMVHYAEYQQRSQSLATANQNASKARF